MKTSELQQNSLENHDTGTLLLVVSFGTTMKEAREKSLEAIRIDLQEKFPDLEVRECFTSGMVIRKILREENLEIDNPEKALSKAREDGFRKVLLQPTHVMHGFEYDKLADKAMDFVPYFEEITVGVPLLASESDMDVLIDAVLAKTAQYRSADTAVILAGHGTEHKANRVYALLQERLEKKGHPEIRVGTIEAEPSFDDVRADLKKRSVRRVVLVPLMLVAGDHALHDLSGDEEDSWIHVLSRDGYETVMICEGLGEYPEIRALIAEHVRKILS